MPLVRYEIQSELALANRDLYRTAPKNDPEAILEGVAMVGLVGIVRQLGDLAEFAADVFHELHGALLATASRSHDLVSRVSQLEGELGAVEKSMFSKKTNHLQFAYGPGVDWRATVPTDQNFCTQGDLPRFIRSAYEACRGPPKLFLLDKFDVQGAGACLKRYTDPSFFKMEWASSEIMKAEKAQQQKKARRGKRARGRKDSDVKPAVQFQSRLRRTLSKSSADDASEDIMTIKSIPSNTNSYQGSSVTSAAAPKSVRRFGSPKPLPPVTSLSRNSELRPKPAASSRALEEDAARGSSDVEQYLDAMTTMESETDSEPLSRRRFYDGFKRTRTAQTKSDLDGDVHFEDARYSETESKYSVELTPIPVDSRLEFEDEAVPNLDSIERTESEQHEGELDDTGSWRTVRVQKMDQYMQALHLKETNGQEISQDIASKPDADNDLEQSGSASGSMHGEAGKSTGGPTNDQIQLLEESNLEARDSEVESELMDAEEAEEAEEAEDEEQFDVELLRVIGHNAAQAQDITKPEAIVADRNLEQQTAEAPMTVEASKEVETVGLDRPDSTGVRMEAADNGSLEGSSVIRDEAESGIPSTHDSTLEADRAMLQAAEKYFSLDSNFEAGELVRKETPEKQNSGASSTSGTSTSLHEAVLVEVKMEENVPLVDDFQSSSSSEDVFMDADAGYQSSSRFSDADYNFGDASSEQFEQMESLAGRSEELPSSMQITPDKDDDSAADQHVYYGGHDTEEQVPETSEAVFEKQPGGQPLDEGTKEGLLPQQQTEQIAEERTKETVLEQQLAEQEALLEQPAEQIVEERWDEATPPADQATEQRMEETVLEQEPAEQIAEQVTKEAPITVEQITDQTNEEASTAAEHVVEHITKELIEGQQGTVEPVIEEQQGTVEPVIEEQQGTVEPVIEEQPALQQGIAEAVIELQLREQVFEQGFKDVPQLGEQVLQQGVKQTESPAKDLSSPVSSTGSPVLQFCPETGSDSFKLGALPLSPPDVSSESSSSPSSSSSSSPRFPVFSALRAPLSPTRRAGDYQRTDIETFLSPSSPTSTSELPSYPPSEPREMPPLPPLPPLRWLASLSSRDSQLSRAIPSLSAPTLVETTKQADEAHVPMQVADAPTQQTDAPMQQTQQTDAVEDEMLEDVLLQHADPPKLEMPATVHSRELDVGATAQQPPSSDEEDDDVPELEIPEPSPELEIPEPDLIHKMRTTLEVPRGLLETPVGERQEADIGISTGVPEQKASHLEIQEAATEASPEPEVPAEPTAAVLENELEVTSAPLQEQEPGFPAAPEATEVPEQEASHLEIQEAATEASPEPEVPGEPILNNELEVTSAPLQEQEPGFSAAENELIQQALNEDHSGPWRMAMQLEYDALKMKMEITETSQQTGDPTVAGSADVEQVVEQPLETELDTSAKELEPEIPEADAEVRREIEEAIVVEVRHLSEQDASELPAAGDVSTIPDSGEQVVLKQVALDETEPGEVMVPEDVEELQRPKTLDLVGRPEVVEVEEELAAKQTLDTESKQSPAVDSKDQMPVPETPETEDGLKTQLPTSLDDDAPLVVFPKPGDVLEPTVELHDTLPVSTMPLKKETGDDLLIKAISQHDRSKLKKVASDLRPPPKAPDERDVLLEQIRSQSFNLRQTVAEKKEKPEVRQQPRIMSNINVAAILEKANAIRQAFVGSDDDEDDDWSDS